METKQKALTEGKGVRENEEKAKEMEGASAAEGMIKMLCRNLVT